MNPSRLRLHWRCHARVRDFATLAGLLVGCSVLPGPLTAQRSAPAPTALAFRGVTVIDVTTGRRLRHQTVVVVGPRIQAIGPAQTAVVPKGAHVVDARGKYLLPGFWDMHVHAETGDGGEVGTEVAVQDSFHRWLYPRYIANGITGIREMAQRWGAWKDGGNEASDSFRAWQREIAAGTLVGPRGIGPSTDVDSERSESFLTVGRIPSIMDSLKAAGDAFVKYHSNVWDREIFFALLREGRRVGLPVVGHVTRTVTNVEAADSGMRGIEHFEHHQCWPWPQPLPDSVALETACRPVVQAYIRNGTWLTPTLSADWSLEPAHAANPFSDTLAEATQAIHYRWADRLRFWRMMHRLGVRTFLAGTDWGSHIAKFHDRFRPGLSARDELVFLVEVGLTPLEAVQAGTLNPALFLRATDSLGTIAAGKLADLVLLDADPLADITNVLKLWGVVANGRYFDHATLVQMDSVALEPGSGLVAWDRQLKRASQGSSTGRPPP